MSARIQRAVMQFDTSNINPSNTIQEASLLIYVLSAYFQKAWSLMIVDPDTVDCPVVQTDYGVLKDSTVPASSLVPINRAYWFEIPLNAYGISLINKGGTTHLALRSNRDVGATDPEALSKEFATIAGLNSFYSKFLPRLVVKVA